jgi:plasmid stability protein
MAETATSPAHMDTSTKAILIRDVPEDLHRVMKASAAMSGMSLQAWCLDILKDRVQTNQSPIVLVGSLTPRPATLVPQGEQTPSATSTPSTT